jgi:hypothetical protein
MCKFPLLAYTDFREQILMGTCEQYRSRLALDGGFRAQEDWHLTIYAYLYSR